MATIEIVGGANNAPQNTEKPKETESKKNPLDKMIKYIKKNPFMVALGVVAVAGLYTWYRSTRLQSGAEESAEGYFIPQTYTVGGGSSGTFDSSYSDNVTGTLIDSIGQYTDNLANAFDEQLSNMQQSYDNSTSALVSQVETLNERFDTTQNVVRQQTESIERQNAINKMMQNSDLYKYATTTAEKNALHAENQALASQYGWTFNDSTGYWYDESGNRLYQTVLQSQGGQTTETISQKTASSSSTVKSGGSSSSSSSGSKKSSSSSSSSSSSKKVTSGGTTTKKSSSSSSSSSGSTGYVRADGTKVGNVKSGQQYIGSDGKWHST